jgi:hypothetical protein
MKKSSQFENILDECLERLIKGETVEQCLESYPEQALELEPLLRTTQATREAVAITPRADFKARARYEFRSALYAEVSQKTRSLSVFKRGWVVALMVIGILLVSGGGTALAAGNSMPDSPLYRVKLATEQVQLALTPSDVGKAELCAAFADRRLVEIIYLANKGDAQQIEAATQRLDERLSTLVGLVSVEGVESVPVEETPRVLTEDSATTAPSAPSPATETVPMSPQAPTETTTEAPTETTTTAPPTEAAPPPVAEDADTATWDVSTKNGGRADLKVKIATDAATHLEALQSVLEGVSPSVQSALQYAIIVSENGYRRVLDALD